MAGVRVEYSLMRKYSAHHYLTVQAVPLVPILLAMWPETAAAHVQGRGLSEGAFIGWPWAKVGLLAIILSAVLARIWRVLRRQVDRQTLVRIAALAGFVLYLSTLGPHVSHHIGEASAGASDCTVLIVTDDTHSGLAEHQPPPVPAPDTVSLLPVPEASRHFAIVVRSTHARPTFAIAVARDRTQE